MSTIPVSEVVRVNPSVLGAGGSAVDLNGLILTANTRVPIGAVLAFSSLTAVGAFFGLTSTEYTLAVKYFAGYNNSFKKPGKIFFAQYPLDDVSAYLRGGNLSSMTTAQLQALSGPLSITVDGVVKAATIDLSTATSFSNAAQIIANDLSMEGEVGAHVTASIGGHFSACTTAGTVLTVGAVTNGSLQSGDTVTASDGTNALNATVVNQLTGMPGAAGTYTISAAATPGNLTTTTVLSASKKMKVTVVADGAVAVSDVISGAGVTVDTYVTGLEDGTTGGIGVYDISVRQTVAPGVAITVFTPAVQYDSVSGAFVFISGTDGASSTITFATGSLATALLLTSATGAVLSQGANAATPAAFMTALTLVTRNFAGWMLSFNPDVSGNDIKFAFAQWNATQNQKYCYAAWDSDAQPTTTVPAPNSLAGRIYAAAAAGCNVNWSPDASLAAFVCGTIASIDYTRTNGRVTFKMRAQSGFEPTVTDQTVFDNLAANNYNSYGAYGADNDEEFNWYANGAVSGDFVWMDSYINQIFLNKSFTLSLVRLLLSVGTIPYNSAGRALVKAALGNDIKVGLNFGIFRAGVTLSDSQIAAVNALAGMDIASALSNQGWYLLVQDASPTVRAARGSPPCTFFYVDGQSVQEIDLASIALQ